MGCLVPGRKCKNGLQIDYSIVIRKTKNLKIERLDFFASTLDATGSKKIGLIDDITIDSVNFYFPSSSRRMLQEYSVPKSTTLLAKYFGNTENYVGIKVENCKFIGAEGMALKFGTLGPKSKIYNNLFKWNDWSGQMTLTANGRNL